MAVTVVPAHSHKIALGSTDLTFTNGIVPNQTISKQDVESMAHQTESFRRTVQFPMESVPGKLPRVTIAPDVDIEAAASWALSQLPELTSGAFAEDCVWRDLYAFTGLPRTFFGAEQIVTAWEELIKLQCPSEFALVPGTTRIDRLGPEVAWITLRYTFKTSGQLPTSCSGQIGIIPATVGLWKIWHLSTILEQLDGYPSPDHFPDATINESAYTIHESFEYECCVIGAGFAGLCLSARFKALGVKYLTLEKNERVGDNWRKRYRSATFHTARDFSDFPLDRMFSDDDPYYLNVKQLARGYEHYATKHKLNISTGAELKHAEYLPKEKRWLLTISQQSREIHIRARHIVLAIGGAGQTPVMPVLPGRDRYDGVVLHSAEYVSPDEWEGKRGVVVGTANTGHDVAEDMLKAGLTSVTMVQRGRTDVFPAEVHAHMANHSYTKAIPMEESDRGIMGYPNSVVRDMQITAHELFMSKNPGRYDSLEKAGFKAGLHGDLWNILCGRQGGHVVDVGTSKKIADGLIKIKNGYLSRFTPTGLEFQDGTKLDADVIVFCTGFANDVRDQAAYLVGPEVSELLEDYFNTDDESEVLGAWKPQGVPGIWYHGGGVHFGRFMSRFLALQIKADVIGKPLQTYKTKIGPHLKRLDAA